ncbi:hypothetical protein BVC93_16070 [Mycobacterium sp. MS1601]|uniref:SIR2 family protein n=1 Tax=Mycobacterium sp. MS1601 TaxID=1936029 RepID=UPI000979184B|nr:SIR2 family protein [Mycobacterium sp. MS1601]AQA03685.1 hypothetical protein BVC93_16070 [Mycobacterium sp. MS1601]
MPNDNLAMLVGNGLSIAFSTNLLLSNITQQVIERLTVQYEGRSDEVAQAMRQVAIRAKADDDPSTNFETLIGAFGGQSDILGDLNRYASLTEDNPDMSQAITKVRKFVQEVRQRGIGHTLQVIVENSKPDNGSFGTISNFFSLAADQFTGYVTIANLNYDDLILTEFSRDKYDGKFCDLGAGYGEFQIDNVLDSPFSAFPLRDKNNLPHLIRLLDLHGAVTFWRVGNRQVKIPLAIARKPELWERYRTGAIDAEPLVVLANQHDKIDHVKRDPFQLAYEIADTDFRDSEHWLIVGYSFKDTCVNDLLKRAWLARRQPPKILIVTMGDELTTGRIENVFGWETNKFAENRARIWRDGVTGLGESGLWKSFVG